MEFLLFPSCISGRAIINEFFDYRQLINLIIMDQFTNKEKTLGEKIVDQSTNKEQPPSQLMRYLVGPSLSMESLNNCEGHYPGAFSCIPKEVFLLMVDYLNYLDIRELEQICRPFFVTIWLERLLIQGSFTFWLPKEIKYSRNKYSYELCMVLHKKRAIYKDVCYFGSIMNQSPPQFCEENPPQWNIITLEGQTDDDIINRSWDKYFRKCINLHCLKLVNVNDIGLYLVELTKLEILSMKLKPVDLLNISITPPSSVKAIVVSTSEKNDQKLRVAHLYLNAKIGTQFDIL
jgi:hypothetical protein